MHRTLPYIILFVTLTLLQIFLFNNLAVGAFFSPLVYLVFLLLLPLETPAIAMLGLGLLMGLTMDYTMGVAGLNCITTLAVAFFRPKLIHLLSSREDLREDGIPSPERMGKQLFWSYVVLVVVLHHTLFFSLEALSWDHAWRTVLRILLSSAGTVLVVGITERLFSTKIATRV